VPLSFYETDAENEKALTLESRIPKKAVLTSFSPKMAGSA